MPSPTEEYDLNSIREGVVSALTAAGHTVAAQLIDGSTWTIADRSLSIGVQGLGKKMLAPAVNATSKAIIHRNCNGSIVQGSS